MGHFSVPNVLPGPCPGDGLLQPNVEHLFALRAVHLGGHGPDVGPADAVLHLADQGGDPDEQTAALQQNAGPRGEI